MNEYITIPLSKKGKHAGKYVAIVSIEDSDLADFNWMVLLQPTRNTNYAERQIGTTARKHILLHRVILERVLGRVLAENEVPDHINGNGLDNRRENLRVATKAQNHQNAQKRKDNTSGYKGVSLHKETGRYVAYINANSKRFYLGIFPTIEEAYQARQKALLEHHKEFGKD